MLSGLLAPGCLAVFAVTLGLARWLFGRGCRGSRMPPGPRQWPIIGSLPALFGYPVDKNYLAFTEMAQKYGGLFTVKMGSYRWVVVADAAVARHMFVRHARFFSDRPTWLAPIGRNKTLYGDYGVIWESGEAAKQTRRFLHTALRDFGVGKKSIEERISEEVVAVVGELSKCRAQPVNPAPLLSQAVSNIISSIVFGDRYDYSNPEFQRLLQCCHEIARDANSFEPSLLFSWLYFLPPNKQIQNLCDRTKEVLAIIEQHIASHKQSFDPDNIRDFVDLYLQQEQNGYKDWLSGDKIKVCIFELYFGGTDTTSTALSWALLYMINHTDVQARCQAALDGAVGRCRAVRLADRQRLPYIEATLSEVMRIATILPLAPFHDTTETVEISGYTIPRRTVVVLSQHSINMDPNVWGDPQVFRPERWLNDDGEYVKNDAFLGFGVGPRLCLGEQLGRSELFLFFCGLLQHFSFCKESADQQMDMEGVQGITLQPKPYKLKALPRQKAMNGDIHN